MHSDGLEQLIGRKLVALPRPAAPATLRPRVLAAVRSHLARPWYQRAWRTWPVALQAASFGLLAAAFLGSTLIEAMAPGLWSRVPELIQSVSGSVTTAVWALLIATDVLRRTFVEPIVVYFVVFALVTGTAAAALGVALKQVVTQGGILES